MQVVYFGCIYRLSYIAAHETNPPPLTLIRRIHQWFGNHNEQSDGQSFHCNISNTDIADNTARGHS